MSLLILRNVVSSSKFNIIESDVYLSVQISHRCAFMNFNSNLVDTKYTIFLVVVLVVVVHYSIQIRTSSLSFNNLKWERISNESGQIQISDSDSSLDFRFRFQFRFQISDSDFRFQIQISDSDSKFKFQSQISDADSSLDFRFRFQIQISF